MARSLAATRRRQLAARAFDDASPALPRHSQASLASPPSPPASLVQCDAAVFRGPMREPVRESRCASRCESRCEKADARDAAASESRGEIRSESSSRHGDPAGVRAASAAGMTLYHAEPPCVRWPWCLASAVFPHLCVFGSTRCVCCCVIVRESGSRSLFVCR